MPAPEPSWLDPLLVAAAVAGALLYLGFSLRRQRQGQGCASGCCPGRETPPALRPPPQP